MLTKAANTAKRRYFAIQLGAFVEVRRTIRNLQIVTSRLKVPARKGSPQYGPEGDPVGTILTQKTLTGGKCISICNLRHVPAAIRIRLQKTTYTELTALEKDVVINLGFKV